jgi:uncharacterized phage protein gp47/JayE
MQLSLLNFNAIVSNSAAAVQSACSKLLNLTTGSVLRSILEAFASIGLWLQYLIVQVWLGCRLATSTGADVDSFVQDYGMQRLKAVAATGQVTLSRASASQPAQIVPWFNADGTTNTSGLAVTTLDGSQEFGVITDTTSQWWNAALGAYLIPPATTSIDVTVQALTAGSAGNVQANTISLLAAAVPFVDTVNNVAPFLNGQDAETDTEVKARFQNYISTLARGTKGAVAYAIASTQQGISYSIRENQDALGNYLPGNFVAMIELGSSPPTPQLISSVYAAIDAVRPIGSTFSVLAPTIVTVTISMTITVGPNGNKNVLIGSVQNAILDYIDILPVAAPLPWSKLIQIAYETDPNITNVSQVLLNGGTVDVNPGISGVIRAGTVAIN